MFRRDVDQPSFEFKPPKLSAQRPPGQHKPPHPPPYEEPNLFVPFPPFPGLPTRSPLPMSKESLQEIRYYMLLLIISENPKGATGYQLQDKYHFPRGTLIRTLQDLEEKNYLKSREETIEGRANKFYMITEDGKMFLEELKLKWATLFEKMAEIDPIEGMKMMIFEEIEEFETLDDAIDYFRKITSWIKGTLKRIENRIEKFKKTSEDLDNLIEEIEKLDSFNKKKIREIVIESIKKMDEK